MKLTERINFRQPKYMLPAIVYLPLLGASYFIFDLFDTKVAEKKDANMQTTEYLNPNLPQAHIKGGDGIGGKYENMLNAYGKIEDHSAVENIDRDNEQEKEEYQSKYSDAELQQLDAEAKRQAELEKTREAQEAHERQRENEALAELNKALAEARLKGQQATQQNSSSSATASDETTATAKGGINIEGKIKVNENARKEADENDKPSEVVKKVKTSSDYFNTLAVNEKEPTLIKAIIDENVKAVDGSRVRLRLLDDVEIGEMIVKKGAYLYATMSGFSSQRVKGTVKSVLVDDEIVKINLSLYDTDGMEVSGSAFIPLYYKKSSNSIFLIGCYCFFHLSGSKSLYFSNGVLGCHSTVFSMTSLMYSNRLTPFCLHEIAIEYRIAPRLAPSCEPKNNEFLLDSDMYLWILSI